MTQQEKVYKALDDLGIEYKVIHHQEVLQVIHMLICITMLIRLLVMIIL